MNHQSKTMVDRNDIIFRQAIAADAPWIIERHTRLYAYSDGFDESFRGFVERVVNTFFANEDPVRERGWIAMRDDNPIGSIFCNATAETDVARLRLFFLEPSFRGMGLGRLLLSTCIEFARAENYRQLVLSTHESHSAACRLYEKNGFQRGETQKVTSFGVAMTEVDYLLDLT